MFTSINEFRALNHFQWNSFHFKCSFDPNMVISFTSGLVVSNNTSVVLHLEIYSLKCILALNKYYQRWLRQEYASCNIAQFSLHLTFDLAHLSLLYKVSVSLLSLLFLVFFPLHCTKCQPYLLPSKCPFLTIPVATF